MALQDHPKSPIYMSCDFLLVISSNLGPILHCLATVSLSDGRTDDSHDKGLNFKLTA